MRKLTRKSVKARREVEPKITSRLSGIPANYQKLLEDIKARIRKAQIKASLSVNRELIRLYWDIGKSIIERQRAEGWGKSVVERLAADLQREFPGVGGFSAANIWRMRAFYLAYTKEVLARAARESKSQKLAQAARELDGRNLPSAVREIPWFHNVVLVEKLKDPRQRVWCAQQTIINGWSRAVLVHQIESGLYARQGKAITNFRATLPQPQSDLADQLLKDPYNFGFLNLEADIRERKLEQGLLNHIHHFLLELGVGFSFVGRQVHLEVGGEDYYIDLLFYHLLLRCFVVIDLKVVPFKPEFAGKMNFYLSAVDDRLRHQDDQPSIGIILCKSKDRITVEYTLRDTRKPIGVSEYRLTSALPKQFRDRLPAIEELEAELRKARIRRKKKIRNRG